MIQYFRHWTLSCNTGYLSNMSRSNGFLCFSSADFNRLSLGKFVRLQPKSKSGILQGSILFTLHNGSRPFVQNSDINSHAYADDFQPCGSCCYRWTLSQRVFAHWSPRILVYIQQPSSKCTKKTVLCGAQQDKDALNKSLSQSEANLSLLQLQLQYHLSPLAFLGLFLDP